MKIVLVHNTYQQPGGEDVVFEQERRLLEQMGHTVVTYCRSNHEIEELSAVGRTMLVIRTVWASDTHRDFTALLVRENPDIVHVHNTFVMVSPSIYSVCRQRGVPVVQTLHNFRLLCPGALFLRDGKICEDCVEHSLWHSVWHGCYRGSRPATAPVALMLAWHRRSGTWDELIDRYIALTEFARNKFIASGFPADKIVVKPNFVDPDPGAKHGAGEGALFVGRLSKEKGLLTLLDAWKRLPKECSLQIIGDGPQRQELEQEAQRCGISSIQFRGQLSHSETLATIKNSRFLVLPSQWYEGFPMTVAESFACGTPVICSKLGAMEEIVADSRTGLHFAPESSEDLARKLAWAFGHPSEMSAMGRAARVEYESHYTPQSAYRQLMDIYEQTVAAYAYVRPA
ncbi:MAG: glycosyltransferase family 4 protein [Candidatus Acidiferrales bacterium]